MIGNLREVAERFAPGRACISVVSGHGSIEKDLRAMEFIPVASEAQEMLSERDRFLAWRGASCGELYRVYLCWQRRSLFC